MYEINGRPQYYTDNLNWYAPNGGTQYPQTSRGARIPQRAPRLPMPPTEEELMKSAFSRGGLSMLALHGSLSTIGTVFLFVFGYVAVILAVFVGETDFQASYDLPDIYSALANSPVLLLVVIGYVIGMVAAMLVGILLMKKILKRINPIAPEKRGLTAGEFLLALAFSLGMWGIGVLLGNFPSMFYNAGSSTSWLYRAMGTKMLPFYAYTIIGAPIFEELTVRKVLCGSLSKFGKAPAIIASALLFGLLHSNSGQFSLAFLVGIAFGCIYLYSGKIIYTIIIHATINLIGTLPELFALAEIDIYRPWELGIAVLAAAGIVSVIICRKHPMLRPEPSAIPNSRKLVFSNMGMKIAIIAGLVTTVAMDLIMLYSDYSMGVGPICLVRLGTSAVTAILVILTVKLTCKGAKPNGIPSEE